MMCVEVSAMARARARATTTEQNRAYKAKRRAKGDPWVTPAGKGRQQAVEEAAVEVEKEAAGGEFEFDAEEELRALKLSLRHNQFVREYVIDFNAPAAYVRAGFTASTKDSITVGARELLRQPKILRAVGILVREQRAKARMTGEDVVRALEELTARCMQAAPVFDKEGRLIEGVFRQDSQGAAKALELLGKHHGIFEKDNEQRQMNVTIVEVGVLPAAELEGEVIEGEVREVPMLREKNEMDGAERC